MSLRYRIVVGMCQRSHEVPVWLHRHLRSAVRSHRLDSPRRPEVMTEREQHDYPAMLADLQAYPNEERVVWRRPLTDKSSRQAAAVAGSLRSWIDYPHRDERGHIACHRDGCDPFHKGVLAECDDVLFVWVVEPPHAVLVCTGAGVVADASQGIGEDWRP